MHSLKKELFAYMDHQKDEMLALGEKLFLTPELGFKEFQTKKHLLDFLKEKNISIEKEYFETGFQISFGEGKPHIALIAELDAIPVLDHPFTHPETQAAHACGHSTQSVNMLLAFLALKENSFFQENERGKITLFFTPAEEYIDLNFREKLIQEGKINHIGGKLNMIEAGLFDDVDLVLHLHAMCNDYAYACGSSLAGFRYKKISFLGQNAHAGVAPYEGKNALHMFTLFQNGLGMLKDNFIDPLTKVHGIVTQGGESINSVPAKVVYEAYIRCLNLTELLSVNEKINTLAKHCAKALGGEAEIQDKTGYLPLIPHAPLAEIVYQNILPFAKENEILLNEKSMAGGDLGDLSALLPTLQLGYNGFSGRIHGKDFKIEDPYKVYIEPAKIIGASVLDLCSQEKWKSIKQSHIPLSKEAYLNYLSHADSNKKEN